MVSAMNKMQRIRTLLAAHGKGARRRLLLVGMVVLAGVMPTAPIFAFELLDRWWDDVTGRTPTQSSEARTKPPPGGTAAAAPAATPAAAPSVAQPQAPAAPPIPVVRPKVQAVSDTLEITGNAAAVNQVKLIARVTGFLEQIHFEDGALVRKGDLLFTIQQDQYKAQLQQAQAQSQLQQAALVYAKTEVMRYTALLKRDAATQVDVDHWNFEQKSAEANILSAQAQVAIAQLNLSYTEVRAPFDGLMGKHLIDIGNVVGGSGQQAALADITQLDPIYVVANISTQQAQQIRANLDQRRLTLAELHQIPIDVALTGETGFPHRGTIEYVAPAIDPATGTLLVRGILPNPTHALLPGVFVTVRLPMGRTTQSALLVPDRALQEDQGGRYVLVVGTDDLVQQRYVQTGALVGNLRVLTGGLNANDRIVVGELWRASPGTKVTPQLTEIGQ
jgi:RND family efflux transporter MFP subunit